MIKRVYITGALGFIGGYVVEECLRKGWKVLGIDSETYAANLQLLEGFKQHKNFTYLNKDINDLNMLYDCDYIINLAAETHVDNSIVSSDEFIKSNIDGVHNLLKLIQTKSRFTMPTLVQFSTDEIYGDLITDSFDEDSPIKPSNPYSATKASADLLIQSYHRTFNIPYLIVRPTNNYGERQYIEKFIPKTCQYLTLGKKVPLHEHGKPIRTWLHARDTAKALMHLLELEKVNDVYNISGDVETTNLNVFKSILTEFGYDEKDYEQYADFSVKRPGQDVRYSIDDTKLRLLGWNNIMNFDIELPKIVQYHKNKFIW